jgi:CBS-domain-containing membrane protein
MQRMMAADIGFLPICEGGRIVGVVTDRDILMRCVARHCDPRATRAADIMTAEVRCCAADNSTEDALAAMRENHVRRLPVLDTERRLVGVVSYSDLTGERSAHAPYHVVFHKTVTDDYGRSRQVEIERVRVGPGHTKAEAVAAAIREVERARRQAWHDVADGYSVIDLQAPAAPAGT